ncbi:hypothetical protein SAM40697_3914 [Streptomyces ambofaciens]|uniref:Integral membrane protein n=1 Tax=Streptomyces ambofaciens TaxID=1889 RepID=A0ABM6B2H7_STRAM|nr:DUF3093 family protein [Streptomyces ambofaciens]ANB07872.1 hypothetical protein SAM40697_3914 [Streptomyces ambofaciens]
MRYVEKTPKTWSAICIAVYVAGVAYMGVDTIPDDFGLWLGMCALFLLLLLPCLAVPLSKFVYHRIRIDETTLRVGRERIPLTAVDPASVHAAAQATPPTLPAQYAASLNAVDAPVPGLRAADHGDPRLVGGGWSVPMGMDSVVLRTHQGEPLRIATRDRTAFLTALTHAVTPSVQHR